MNFWHLFRFSGRASREEYALIVAGCFLFSFITTCLQLLFDPNDLISWTRILLAMAIGVISTLAGLVVMWIQVAAIFRRMHDMSLSGVWYIIFLVASIVLVLIFQHMWWVNLLLSLALTLFLCLKKSSPINRFGNPPAAFLPAVFSKRGIFTAVVIGGILISLGQTGISRIYLKHLRLQQMTQLQQRSAQIRQQAVQQQQKRSVQTGASSAPSQRQMRPMH